MAKAYVIVNVNVTDREKYVTDYAPLSTKALEAYGGRALARGGKSETLEGSFHQRAVILEFPDYDTAVKWYHSPEYTAARKAREGAAEANLMVVEGL